MAPAQHSVSCPFPLLRTHPFNPVGIRNPTGKMHREESIWLKEKEAHWPLSHCRQQAGLRPELGKGRRCDIKWNSHDLIFTSNWFYQLVISSPLLLGNKQKVVRFALHLIQGNNWPHITNLKTQWILYIPHETIFVQHNIYISSRASSSSCTLSPTAFNK